MDCFSSLILGCNTAQKVSVLVRENGKHKRIHCTPADLGFSTEIIRICETRYPVDWKTLIKEREKSYTLQGKNLNMSLLFI